MLEVLPEASGEVEAGIFKRQKVLRDIGPFQESKCTNTCLGY